MALIAEAMSVVKPFGRDDEVEDLSDEQIEQLLQQATVRLREQQALKLDSRYAPAVPAASKLIVSTLAKPYIQTTGDIAKADTSRLVDEQHRQLADGAIRKVEDPVVIKQKNLETKKATAGASWYNLPATNLTPELKRDLQLLKMRNVLDPHRHYKKDSSKGAAPAFSHVGTLVAGPTDFFSGRLTNRERKRTLVEEIMEGERESGRMKRKYGEIQDSKRSGKKGDWKKKVEKKYGSGRMKR